MKAGLIEEIQSLGYWRINIRPLQEVSIPLLLPEAQILVGNARVQMRGWDFPHVSSRDDDTGGAANFNDYTENWCDWYTHKEFWRIYKSTQFLAYKALWEDLEPPANSSPRPEGKNLSVRGAIWGMIEFYEFAHRLTTAGLYKTGAFISIELRNNRGRTLWISEWNRAPFSYPRTAQEDTVRVERKLTGVELREDHKRFAVDAVSELFTLFNWTPDRAQLEADSERYYRKEF